MPVVMVTYNPGNAKWWQLGRKLSANRRRKVVGQLVHKELKSAVPNVLNRATNSNRYTANQVLIRVVKADTLDYNAPDIEIVVYPGGQDELSAQRDELRHELAMQVLTWLWASKAEAWVKLIDVDFRLFGEMCGLTVETAKATVVADWGGRKYEAGYTLPVWHPTSR